MTKQPVRTTFPRSLTHFAHAVGVFRAHGLKPSGDRGRAGALVACFTVGASDVDMMMNLQSPRAGKYRMPAEWELHDAVWLAWPSHEPEWAQHLKPAQLEFVALCRAIADLGSDGSPRGERLKILVPDGVRHLEASGMLSDFKPEFIRMRFGDIWMRDIGPIFVRDDLGTLGSVCFAFNGWGGKFILDGDSMVAGLISERQRCPMWAYGIVFEGGALEVDGAGTALTTRNCLLNPNRNPGVEVETIESILGDALGIERLIWLDGCLANDHTDGHIDTLVRFVGEGRVVCMEPSSDDDPNRDVLRQMIAMLSESRDVQGRRLDVVRIPSPGRVQAEDGMVLPASYLNYYISNTRVIVPTYASTYDDAALRAIEALFPDRQVVGLSARSILMGGGAFHCITQQQPKSQSPVSA